MSKRQKRMWTPPILERQVVTLSCLLELTSFGIDIIDIIQGYGQQAWVGFILKTARDTIQFKCISSPTEVVDAVIKFQLPPDVINTVDTDVFTQYAHVTLPLRGILPNGCLILHGACHASAVTNEIKRSASDAALSEYYEWNLISGQLSNTEIPQLPHQDYPFLQIDVRSMWRIMKIEYHEQTEFASVLHFIHVITLANKAFRLPIDASGGTVATISLSITNDIIYCFGYFDSKCRTRDKIIKVSSWNLLTPSDLLPIQPDSHITLQCPDHMPRPYNNHERCDWSVSMQDNSVGFMTISDIYAKPHWSSDVWAVDLVNKTVVHVQTFQQAGPCSVIHCVVLGVILVGFGGMDEYRRLRMGLVLLLRLLFCLVMLHRTLCGCWVFCACDYISHANVTTAAASIGMHFPREVLQTIFKRKTTKQ